MATGDEPASLPVTDGLAFPFLCFLVVACCHSPAPFPFADVCTFCCARGEGAVGCGLSGINLCPKAVADAPFDMMAFTRSLSFPLAIATFLFICDAALASLCGEPCPREDVGDGVCISATGDSRGGATVGDINCETLPSTGDRADSTAVAFCNVKFNGGGGGARILALGPECQGFVDFSELTEGPADSTLLENLSILDFGDSGLVRRV